MRVLLVEDHKPLVRALRQGLEEEGFAVDIALDGEEADYKARASNYDVIILDLMLPKKDGLTLLKEWRRDGSKTHVLVLTARGTLEERVRGLDTGADDYLTKPFELEELLARLRAWCDGLTRSRTLSSAFTIWKSIPPPAPRNAAVNSST